MNCSKEAIVRHRRMQLNYRPFGNVIRLPTKWMLSKFTISSYVIFFKSRNAIVLSNKIEYPIECSLQEPRWIISAVLIDKLLDTCTWAEICIPSREIRMHNFAHVKVHESEDWRYQNSRGYPEVFSLSESQ